MRAEIFYWVLNCSFQGGLVCLLVWLLRRWRSLPRRWAFLLWLGPLMRLTVPFGLSLPWSLTGLLRRLGARTVTLPGDLPVEVVAANCLQGAEDYFPITYKTDALAGLFRVCGLIWLVGALACLGTMITLYVMTRRELREARPLGNGVWVSEKLTSPGLVGVLRPRILVPPDLEGQLLDWVVLHETCHRRRRDNLWRLLALGLCCLHWFNPLVWYSLKIFFQDMELACDEAAIRRLSPKNRRDYALALLSAAQGRDLFLSAFGGAKLKIRIQHVLSYKHLTQASALILALLFCAILSALVFQ